VSSGEYCAFRRFGSLVCCGFDKSNKLSFFFLKLLFICLCPTILMVMSWCNSVFP